ncbi:MAG: FAD:protein FMN transferase [Cyclobacteriaceae bacterium]|nr:FAD:protein FMN transferase [Cyclobacteriaceae bacterium]
MKLFKVSSRLMGSAFQLGIVHHDEKFAKENLQLGIDEIKRLELMFSEFLPNSETSLINQSAARHPVKISSECFGLIKRCLNISQLSSGAFDITVSPLKKLYHFKNENFEMPDKKSVMSTLQSVGFKNIHLDEVNSTIFFSEKNTKISFAAIGKGYASDCVKNLWLRNGFNAGFVNASGDLNAFGENADGNSWKIGIANPDDKSKILMYVPMKNNSVATSGDYEQHFLYKNKRYSHNISPFTGMPVYGIKSVTVFSPSAELSDALATAVYVKGKFDGINWVNQLPYTHAIIIDNENEIHFSKNLNYETVS